MDYLLAENLSCIRGSNTVFKNLSFKVSRGQILHITGANGSGKTSLLRMIAGFIYFSGFLIARGEIGLNNFFSDNLLAAS